MVNVVIISVAIFLFPYQQHSCISLNSMGTAMTAATFVDFLLGQLKDPSQNSEDVIYFIDKLGDQMKYHTERIDKVLTNFNTEIRYAIKIQALDSDFEYIQGRFERTVQMYKRIQSGDIDCSNSDYYDFKRAFYEELDAKMDNIWKFMKRRDVTFFLHQNFYENLKKFENVCKLGVSYLQLLNILLNNVAIITGEYYMTKQLMLDFMELSYVANYTSKKANLLLDTNKQFEDIIQNFADEMKNASQELWACDPVNGPNEKTVSKYNVYSEVIMRADFGQCDKISSSECHEKDEFCKKLRKCPNEVSDCKALTNSYKPERRSVDVCLNKNPLAYHRYLSFSWHQRDDGRTFQCTDGIKEIISGIPLWIKLGIPRIPQLRPYDYCHCICRENDYFINLTPIAANYQNNKIVTGARFAIKNRVLHIEVEESRLLPNGAINGTEWISQSTDTDNYWKVSRSTAKEIALTNLIIPNDEVITGFRFIWIWPKPGRFGLGIYSNKFNFTSGIVDPSSNQFRFPNPGRTKYDLTNSDVPTKSYKENVPHSLNDQYTEFTTTSLELDGGQTTIPFIDIQNVRTNPASALSGAGLYIRGQPGFGGYLAIKLFTFDVKKYILERAGLEELDEKHQKIFKSCPRRRRLPDTFKLVAKKR